MADGDGSNGSMLGKPASKGLPSVKPNQPAIAGQNISHIPLHTTKLNEPASLTLQMIEHRRQSLKLLSAPLIRTMIDILRMRRALQMLIQTPLRSKLSMTQITFVAIAVPGVTSRPRLFTPFEEILGDEATAITLSELLEDEFPVYSCGIGA